MLVVYMDWGRSRVWDVIEWSIAYFIFQQQQVTDKFSIFETGTDKLDQQPAAPQLQGSTQF